MPNAETHHFAVEVQRQKFLVEETSSSIRETCEISTTKNQHTEIISKIRFPVKIS